MWSETLEGELTDSQEILSPFEQESDLFNADVIKTVSSVLFCVAKIEICLRNGVLS